MAVKRERVDKKDFFRILQSETIPSDSPIVFSNKGFYKIAKDYCEGSLSNEYLSKIFKEAIKPDVANDYLSGSSPFKYSILKSETKIRGLSLLHPRSQLAFCDFLESHYPSLIYYCSRSKFSLRKATRVASKYTPKIDENSNSLGVPSFFSIEGIDRIYKFFESQDFAVLESRFPLFATADVANCFNSIYTHTIPWATHGKKYNSEYMNHKVIFGNVFDIRMQRSNNNETNGIAIGNEISRIFAEILFQKIDLEIEAKLTEFGLTWGKEYQIFRYVDDYFIFSVNHRYIKKCLGVVTECLHNLNFALNQSKTHIFERPFASKIACTAIETKELLGILDKSMFDKIKVKIKKSPKEPNSYLVIKPVYKPLGMVSKFIAKVRVICLTNNGNYKDISSLIIGSMKRKVALVENGLSKSQSGFSPINNIIVFMEIAFFFYNANPQSSTSRTLCGIILKCDDIIARFSEDDLPFFRSIVIEKIELILHGSTNAELDFEDPNFLPFEKLNVLLSTHNFNVHEKFSQEMLFQMVKDKKLNYFDIISLIYYTKGDSTYSEFLNLLELRAIEISKRETPIRDCSEKCHLVLDLLACPFISRITKAKLLKNFSFIDELLTDDQEMEMALTSICSSSWFVDWDDMDLGKMILDKELIRGY
jgi:hypothetical protein